MSSFPTTPSVSLYTQVRTAIQPGVITPTAPVLLPAEPTNNTTEARPASAQRVRTLTPIQMAGGIGLGVVGLLGLHQVWGKVHAFLFGEPVPAKPTPIPPLLDPVIEVPEPPPVRKAKPQTKSMPKILANGKRRERTALRFGGRVIDKTLKITSTIVDPNLKLDPRIGEWLAEVLNTVNGKALSGILAYLYFAFTDKIPNPGELIKTLNERLSHLNPDQYFTGLIDVLHTLFQSAS